MSYRIKFGLVAKKDLYDEFVNECEKDKELTTALEYLKERVDDQRERDGYTLVYVESLKCTSAIYEFLNYLHFFIEKKFKDKEIQVILLGEDNEDVEMWGCVVEDPFGMCLKREISYV